MASSGTYDFTLDIYEIIEEAYERCGLELRTGHQLRSARRSLDLLMTSWANNQVNLWTLDQADEDLTASTASYSISLPTIDVLDAVIRDSDSIDTPIDRISIEEYLTRPDKASTGRPTHFAIEHNTDTLKLYLWPVPDLSTYSFIYWRMRIIQDAGVYTNNPEVPRQFIPALVAGLAIFLANKNPAKMLYDQHGNMQEVNGVGQQRRSELATEYTQTLELAMSENRDRASMWILPYGRY